MDFTLTDEQTLLRDTARTLFTKECPASLVRAHIDDPAVAEPLWRQLSEWEGLADGPLVDLCLFLEEAGGAVAPGPFFATAALYRPLMRAAGREPAARGTIAMAGADGEWRVSHDRVRTFVLEADRVDEIAIVVPGGVVVTGPLPTRLMQTLDSTRRPFELDVPLGPQTATPVGTADLDRVIRRATVGLAAELVGTARRLSEMTVDYVKERAQFGRPIGAFQAVQHRLADVALEVERATAAVYYAALALDAGDDEGRRATHVAKAAAGRAATGAARAGIQLHGGVGYTWEHDLHLLMRRAYASEHLMGTSAWHHDRLADLLFDASGRHG